MEDAHLAEQEHADSRAFPFADLRPEGCKERLDVGPTDRSLGRAGEDQFQRGSVPFSSQLSTPEAINPVVGLNPRHPYTLAPINP